MHGNREFVKRVFPSAASASVHLDSVSGKRKEPPAKPYHQAVKVERELQNLPVGMLGGFRVQKMKHKRLARERLMEDKWSA